MKPAGHDRTQVAALSRSADYRFALCETTTVSELTSSNRKGNRSTP